MSIDDYADGNVTEYKKMKTVRDLKPQWLDFFRSHISRITEPGAYEQDRQLALKYFKLGIVTEAKYGRYTEYLSELCLKYMDKYGCNKQ